MNSTAAAHYEHQEYLKILMPHSYSRPKENRSSEGGTQASLADYSVQPRLRTAALIYPEAPQEALLQATVQVALVSQINQMPSWVLGA